MRFWVIIIRDLTRLTLGIISGTKTMRCCSCFTAIVLLVVLTLPASSQEKVKPVRMGCGMMTFDTVPGWGLRPDGSSALGSTHGGVVIDKAGNIYTSAKKGVVVFSPERFRTVVAWNGKSLDVICLDVSSNISLFAFLTTQFANIYCV